MRLTLVLICFAGLFVNGLVLAPYVGETNEAGQFDGLGLWVALAHGLGGALAGFLLAGAFGRSGIGGWVISFFAAISVILLGAIAGGILIAAQGMITADDGLIVAVIRGATGAIAAPVAMANLPGLWLVPPLLTIVAHLAARRARKAEAPVP